MIREARKEELKELVDFMWKKYLETDGGSYPKHENYDSLKEGVFHYHHRDDKLNLIMKDGSEIKGAMSCHYIQEENYLATLCGLFVEGNHKTIAQEFIQYFQEKYKGVEFTFGYSTKYKEAIEFVKEIGGKPIEHSLLTQGDSKSLKNKEHELNVVRLEEKHYEEYSKFHDIEWGETGYWTSERVIQNIDEWQIYILISQGEIVGSTLFQMNGDIPHIFGILMDDNHKKGDIAGEFIIESSQRVLSQGYDKIRYFADAENQWEVEAVERSGYNVLDEYRAYKKVM